MKLYEYEGKQLLAQYSIPVPDGWLWSDRPEERQGSWMAKAQVLSGGRGKAGGILPVTAEKEMQTVVAHLQTLTIQGENVHYVYMEEMVSFAREIYLAIMLDRNQKGPVLLASTQGGIDIESVPKEEIICLTIHPFIGLPSYMIRYLSEWLKISIRQLDPLIRNLWQLFIREQAQLVEINPLFVREDGTLCAGDAKLIVMEKSFPFLLPREQESFEVKCSNLGAVGVELDGDIAVVTSGAGLGMATLDWIVYHQRSVRAMVDLGGQVIHDLTSARQLMREIVKLRPKGILCNSYFQVASCSVMGRAIAMELGDSSIPVSVRLKGKDAEAMYDALNQYNQISVFSDLEKALTNMIEQIKGDE